MALKADLVESAPRPQGQIMNQMSGSGVSKPRQASKSPGRPRDRGASRGREKTKSPNKGSNKSQERSQSGAHECWTCHEVVEGNHFGYNCPKGEKEGEEKRPITPYPRRDRSASGDKTKASQGNETYRRFRGHFGDPGPGPWKIIMRSPVQSAPATADVGAAPAAVPAAPAQPDAITAPGGGLKEEDRRSWECGEHSQRETVHRRTWCPIRKCDLFIEG